jgi:hypothetical protein
MCSALHIGLAACTFRSSAPSVSGRPSIHEQPQSRAFLSHQLEEEMAKVVCVLYDDPVTGYPKSYALPAG